MLTASDHSRVLEGFAYVYPVLSRRAGGVSVGINLNPNNACNWQCVYCQVPGLIRGKAPKIDLGKLESELRAFLMALCRGDWLRHHAPEGVRTLRDIAFSGNGEPTSAKEFADAVTLAARLRDEFELAPAVALRLITNGSLLGQERVREGIRRLGQAGGEVWFKVDAGRADAIERINGVRLSPETLARNLKTCASLCPTKVQTCVFRWDGLPPSAPEIDDWLNVLAGEGAAIREVLLYGVARPPRQAGSARISPLSAEEFDGIAEKAKEKGLTVRVSP
ncbi:MAG: radical SAM protein [Azoarcus sp.]|jgi:wyosine [tRNA(Phe)-imidazoG37] synthetase (radical SAM superfamily)|nr:radical SAM protein [Azoarcus sp.]